MRKIAALLIAVLLLSGCSEKSRDESAVEGLSSLPGEEEVAPPQGPPDMPELAESGDQAEESPEESQPLPALARIELTAEEAAEMLNTDQSGVLRISTPKELCALTILVNSGDTDAAAATVKLEDDISLAGMEFVPIGSMEAPFNGSVDGGGHIISGLTVLTGGEGAGLFGSLGPQGKLEDIHIIGGQVYGKSMVGGLAGYSQGRIVRCSYRGMVSASGRSAGGACGELDGVGELSQCVSNAQVEGNSMTGGLCGSAGKDAVISDSYALGSVTAIQGEHEEPEYIGGLCGSLTGTMERCYASIEVYTKVSSRVVGGFVGINKGDIRSCYYNKTPTENWKGVGYSVDDAPYEVTGCNVEEITDKLTFAGWDFVNIWNIADDQNRGLPYLRAVWE